MLVGGLRLGGNKPQVPAWLFVLVFPFKGAGLGGWGGTWSAAGGHHFIWLITLVCFRIICLAFHVSVWQCVGFLRVNLKCVRVCVRTELVSCLVIAMNMSSSHHKHLWIEINEGSAGFASLVLPPIV